MFVRLYFLLPNEETAQQLVPGLLNSGINKDNIHALVRNSRPGSDLPSTTKWQRMDLSHMIESVAWNTNLLVFFLALASLPVFLLLDMNIPAILSIVVMAVSFILGDAFALLIPKVHLNEFEHALSHGEVLLMVDTSRKNSARIEDLISRHYPAAVPGGSCWTINAIGI